MKPMFIKPLVNQRETNMLEGEFLTRLHYRELIRPDVPYIDDESGKLVCLLVKQCLPADICQQAYEQLRKVSNKPDNRGTAVAGKGAMMPRLTRDGSLSNRTKIPRPVWEAAGKPLSDFLGYFDYRDVNDKRKLNCRETEWTGTHLAIYEAALPFIREVDSVFAACLPLEYSVQRDEVKKVADALKIAGTVFTTVTVNKNLRTACHKDEGDLRQGMGCMATLGQWQGSELVFPQFGLAANYQPGDLLLGDVHLWHGNAPFVAGGERVTTVLYCRERMHECGGDADEAK
jgi:2-oxoglutarate-Fe(II)-dependent dioxygenase family protein